MINWRNIAENLVLTLISVTLGVLIGWQLTIRTVDAALEQQKSIIEEAIRKETTSITNEVKTEIRKIKGKKSGPISIEIDPYIKSDIETNENIDSVINQPIEDNAGFFKRLFNKDARLKRQLQRKQKQKQ
jgi:hypothetical protein